MLQAQLAAAPQRFRPPGAEDAAAKAGEAVGGLDAKLAEIKKTAKAAYDRIYYGDVLPPIGSYQISYARWVLHAAAGQGGMPGAAAGVVSSRRCMAAAELKQQGWPGQGLLSMPLLTF